LEEKQIGIKELNVTEAEIEDIKSKASFVISYKNIYGWKIFLDKLKTKFSDKIEFDYNLGALSIIGEGLNRDNETLLASLDVLRKEKIRVLGITTTSYRISFLVARDDLQKSVKIIHNKWIKERA
jgi:aspartokinase